MTTYITSKQPLSPDEFKLTHDLMDTVSEALGHFVRSMTANRDEGMVPNSLRSAKLATQALLCVLFEPYIVAVVDENRHDPRLERETEMIAREVLDQLSLIIRIISRDPDVKEVARMGEGVSRQ